VREEAVRNGLKVFDADSHVVYPPDFWGRYLDARFRDRVQPPASGAFYAPVTVDGRSTLHPEVEFGGFTELLGFTEPAVRARYGDDLVGRGFPGDLLASALAQDGIDLAVVYGPEYAMWTYGIDPELQAGMTRAYNRWGQEMFESSGGRVMAAGPVPLNDVSRAVEEVRYAYEHLGTRCFWARPNHFNGRNLGDRYYDPVWELLQDLDCAFSTHEFQGLTGPSAGSDRFRGYTEWHAALHPHEAQMAIASMICHGVFERFPRLRCAYMEAGSGWLPSWLGRIDEHLELAGQKEFPELTMTATGYFQRNCWISTECEDRFVSDVVRWLGDDHIVFESDFPHPEAKWPRATEEFLALDVLGAESKRKILWDNAMDLYRFPVKSLPAELRGDPAAATA
jgi:uncharacterized protein